MATIYNSDLTKELTDVAKLQVGKEIIPNQIAEKVVPVIDVNPKHARRVNIVKKATVSGINTSVSIYDVPADIDFFLTGFSLSFVNGATSQATLASLTLTPKEMNVSTTIGAIGNITGVAGSVYAFNDFQSCPIQLKRGSTLTLVTNGVNVGDALLNGVVYGYTVENGRA